MDEIQKFIESGTLEAYVLGTATPEQITIVNQMAAADTAVVSEIDELTKALEVFAQMHAVAPNPTVKPFVMAILDFTARMEQGEMPTFPPELQQGALVADYAPWLNRPDMVLPEKYDYAFAKIIGYTPAAVSAIVWLNTMAPGEIHTDEYEKFLIVEGSCDITIGNDVHHLLPGSYMAIPLHVHHSLKVTSAQPCKVILQRIAA